MWCLSQTNADDLVRGRKRQRKKAPKAKTGCATCKIRRVKCDEEKPHCKKCTSTGRHCDGYAQSASAPAYASYADAEPTHISARMPIGVAKASCPSPSFGDFQQSMFDAIWTKGLVCIERFPRNCPVPASLSRAFDYFLHHSSPSLEGLPHIQNWQSYILSISVRSPAIQHAVAALSGLHERYSFPTDHDSEHRQEGWRQYYLSTKQVSVLIDTVQSDTGDGAGAEEEVLVACAIFIAIEILFGDIKTAIRHLKSGISLVQGFLAERYTRISNFQTSQGPSTSQNGRSPTGAASLRSYLDGHLLDLIGFLAFIDLQMMSFLPPDQYVASEDASSQLLSVALQSCRSLPDSLSTKLYFTVSRALHWIRYEAYRYKYHDPKPSALFETQLCLIAQLLAWRHTFNETGETETKPESVNLLLTFHLTLLKLHTALSSTECIFEDTICMDLFRAIMRYATIVLQNRKTERPATRQLSLETNTIEAVYYSAIKCRDVSLRRRAVSLLQCVGREGVWDGLAMAVIAEHAISLEEAGNSATNTFPCGGVFHMCSDPAVAFQPALQEACDDWRYTFGSQVSRRNMALKSLINEITFSVDRDKRNVKVKCGWFCGEKRLWKFDARSLVW